MMPLGFILLLGASLTMAPTESLRSGCEADAPEVTRVAPAAELHVASAIAGREQICYEVILNRDGKEITGYVLGEGLTAVQAFVRQRELAAVSSFQSQDQWARLMAKQAKTAMATSPKVGPAEVFEDFAARDLTGKSISLSGLGGRVTLVTFWTPRSPESLNQLASLMPLLGQYKRKGLRAIGISADLNTSHVRDAVDDMPLNWPQIPDRTGLANKYAANPKAGTTLVLDRSHHIVATGLTGSDLEQKVRQLLEQP